MCDTHYATTFTRCFHNPLHSKRRIKFGCGMMLFNIIKINKIERNQVVRLSFLEQQMTTYSGESLKKHQTF